MVWLAFLLSLALRPPGRADYPPDGVQLIQAAPVVPLRWHLPGHRYHLKVTQGTETIADRFTSNDQETVTVRCDQPVTWQVSNEMGQSRQSTFSVPSKLEFRADGTRGEAQRPGQRGLSGGLGCQVHLRLEPDQNGMHLWIRTGSVDSDEKITYADSGRPGKVITLIQLPGDP